MDFNLDHLLDVLGWKVFPCHAIVDGQCTCPKGAKCSSPGKHPRTQFGVKEATSDRRVIDGWLKQWPHSNLGLACGATSDVVVIDIDYGKQGFESIDALVNSRGELPETLKAKTGGGGRHLFFRYPTSGPIKNRVNWLPGVDIRSDGGYVILAPGTHASGGRYSWFDLTASMAALPEDIATDIRNGLNSDNRGTEQSGDLKDTTAILQGVPEGKRDDTLFRWACRLRRQHSSDEDGGRAAVTALVLLAAEKANFPKDEALIKVEQAFKQDHSDELVAYKPLTDLGNRDRLIQAYGDDIRYVSALGWLQWGDTGWNIVPPEAIQRMAEDVSAMLMGEAEQMVDPRAKKEVLKHAMRTQSLGAITAIEKLARQHRKVYKKLEEFDTQVYELACANGIVDLRNGSLRNFSRDDLVTKNTGVAYRPGLTSDMWDNFLEQSTGGDQELIDYLQMAAGYAATGLTGEESFFVISGPAASGKSTYVDALHYALGAYATTSQSDTFMYRRGRDAPKDEIARLAGMRMVSVAEIREGDSFNEALIKQITGGDKITGRFLYKDTFEYTPQFKLWIATNHTPMSNDSAMMRRIKRIQFLHQVPVEKRDKRLKEAVRGELREVVLAWVVEGAKKYIEQGKLETPTSVLLAVSQYKTDQDVFSMFAADCLRHQPGGRVYFTDLFANWKQWCERLSQHPGRMLPFREKLKEAGYALQFDDNGREYYPDLHLEVINVRQF